jgi:branched-chain amino acid transport system ATP-binding protein
MSEQQGLQVNGVSVAYGKHQALDNVSISVAPGEIVVILGANGAGKSSLLGTISGLVYRNAGSVTVNGQATAGFKAHQVVAAGLALVPEGRGIFGDLTVEENLTLGAYSKFAREREDTQRQLVYQLFPKLIERRQQIARTMSGGEQQMVAIGRAMMSAPGILMLDEPSLGLSPLLASEVFKTLKKVRETGLGILLVEQNAKQSLSIADRGYLLENGRITAEDSAQKLLSDPAVREAYLGGAGSKESPRTHHPASVAQPARPATEQTAGTAAAVSPLAAGHVRPAGLDKRPPLASEQLAGGNIQEWIRNAEVIQRSAWQTGVRAHRSEVAGPSDNTSGSLADMLARMERAARTSVTGSGSSPDSTSSTNGLGE